MSRRKESSLATDFDAVTALLAKGKPQRTPLPTELALKSIRLWPGLFQHRGRQSIAGGSHVRTLATAAKQSPSGTLDPITVWWDGRGWACADGHHRMAAYRLAVFPSSHIVPVTVFEGSIDKAMALAASANTKDKLAMSSGEKSNAAWRMAAATSMSKFDISQSAQVSESTVAGLRRALAQLRTIETAVVVDVDVDDLTPQPPVDIRDLSWADARRLATGKEPGATINWDEHSEKKAQAMALALRKAIGKEGAKHPDILARALEIYDSRLVESLIELWADLDDDDAAEVPSTDL